MKEGEEEGEGKEEEKRDCIIFYVGVCIQDSTRQVLYFVVYTPGCLLSGATDIHCTCTTAYLRNAHADNLLDLGFKQW